METAITTSEPPAGSNPTRAQLLHRFNEAMQTKSCKDSQILELVSLLGGIDVVMNAVLKTPDHSMTEDDRNKMQQCLSDLTSELQMTTDDRMVDDERFTWTLDPKDTALHSLSPLMERYVLHKWVVLFFVLLLVLYGIVAFALSIDKTAQYLLELMVVMFQVPWFLTILLTVNKAMWPRIVRNPDFWIKTGTAAVCGIFFGIYQQHFHDPDEVHVALETLRSIGYLVISVVFLCCVEALGMISIF